jgi:hypothetical protein
MNELFVQATEEISHDFIDFATRNYYGMEIISFAFPWTPDSKWNAIRQSYRHALKDVKNEISVHGVFCDEQPSLHI